MREDWIEAIKTIVDESRIRLQEPMSRHTTFRIGAWQRFSDADHQRGSGCHHIVQSKEDSVYDYWKRKQSSGGR